jgi:uncharacterized membrane protein YhaH (DUF805 family)
MDGTALLFSFQGRINRGKYWLAVLIYLAVWTTFVAVAVAWIGGIDLDNLLSIAGAGLLLWIIAFVLFIAVTWSSVAVGVKRLHDRGKSGWWILLFWFGPGLLGSWPASAPNIGGGFLLSLAAGAIAIWGFVELGCLRGTPGPNQYGPDPLAYSPR